MKRQAFSLLLCLLALLFAGCSADFMAAPGGGRPTATASLIPAYIATAQLAEAAAQATQAAGRGQMAQMDVTASALAVERQALNFQMTQAAATREFFSQQTAEAAAATDTARAVQQATEAAQATLTRQAFFDGGTATVNAAMATDQARVTQAALLVLQASAEAQAQQIRDEQATQNLRSWAVRIFWGLVAVSAFGLVFITLLQFRRLIVSRILLFRYGAKGRGKPYLPVLQRDGSIKVTDPGKSIAPVIDIPERGEAQVQGMADDQQQQIYFAVQAAIADLLLALNTTTAEHRMPWEKDAQGSASPERKKDRSAIAAALLQQAAQQRAQLSGQQAGTRYLPPEIVDTQFREATDEDGDVAGWLGDVERKLLD